MIKDNTRKFYYSAINAYDVSGICADSCKQTFWFDQQKKKTQQKKSTF